MGCFEGDRNAKVQINDTDYRNMPAPNSIFVSYRCAVPQPSDQRYRG